MKIYGELDTFLILVLVVVSSDLQTLVTWPPRKQPPAPIGYEAEEPQGWCGICDEEEKLCPCRELYHDFPVVGPIAQIRYLLGEYFRQFTIFNLAILFVRSINYPQVSKRTEGGQLDDKTMGEMTMKSWFD
jgi:hypothetical protein